jgi:hypothetical protein
MSRAKVKNTRPRCEVCGEEPGYKKWKGRLVGPLCLIVLKRSNNNVGMVIPDWYKKAAE